LKFKEEIVAPRKGVNSSKSENKETKKAHSNPNDNKVVSELERKLRKYTIPQRYISPLKGNAAHQENTSNHHHM
jgi:hypothetical protein